MVTNVQFPRRSVTRAGNIDWAPYWAGIGIGILSWLAFVVVDDPLGITTAFSSAAGYLAMPFIGADAVAQNSYWKSLPPRINYGSLLLIGVVLGGFVAALGTGRFRFETVPQVWRERFGSSVAKRFFGAFIGGVLIMYGARLAGGCTSGHALSGGMQLALSSWIFTVVIFAAGIVTARIVYGKTR